ncbi:MAG: right-handed parallel beta-helix repeat-containing protein [Planctomycetota bacterium]
MKAIMTTGLFLMGLVVLANLAGGAEMTGDFYVAPDGNDASPGTKDKPFATLERARDAVRTLKKDKPITVFVRGGTYYLKQPLLFGPEDSGTEKFSITYAAAPGEKPVLSGGRRITGWKKGENNLWTVELPEVKAGKWYFRQLFVNGRRAVRARSPNDGFFRVVKAGPDNRTSFTFKKGDLRAFRNIEDAEIVFLHDWSVSRVRLKAVDETTNTLTLADPIGHSGAGYYAIAGFGPNPRYAVENAPELLDSPGEWYLDRKAGALSYWPLAGEDPARAEAVAPVLELLLSVRGEAAKGRRVEGLRFVGLSFAHCEFPLPEHGYAEGQAGFYEVRPNPDKSQGWGRLRNPAAVVLENAAGCALEDCAVYGAGGSGISLQGACENNRVTGCRVHDVGGNGIMVGETANKPEHLAKDNAVSNNYVHHCAVLGHGCVGVWAGLTEGTVIAHNEICDLPYTGVSVGWQWDVKPTQCQGNVVEFNHIHRVMQMLSDGGGIYTLGRQPGTVLRGNLIHDIPVNAGCSGSNGMFLDEGSSEFLVEGNTIYGVARSSIRFHKATGLTIRKNHLFTSNKGPFKFNSCQKEAMTFEDNAVQAMPRLSAREEGKAGVGSEPDAIAKARAAAGLEPAYRERLLGGR